MKPLKEQTVYIPITAYRSDFGVIDPAFGELNACVKTLYCLSKDELIELLGSAFDAGQEKESVWNKYQNRGIKYELIYNNTPTKEQFINSLFNQ